MHGANGESSLRGDARQQVAEKWANRRKQQQATQSSSMNGVKTPAPNSSRPLVTLPPLCVALRRSLCEAMKSFQQQRTRPPQRKPAHSLTSSNKRASFPSVLTILQANALKDQVESFDDTGILWNVLPANYNFQQGIVDMSQSRSRVFLLLDLAAIVQTHVQWRKRLGRNVKMVYATKHNANPKLLLVLERLGVGLKVSTKYDLQVCRTTMKANCGLWDDDSSLHKPNSFYRCLILDDSSRIIPLAVDGPAEVERLHQALQRMAQRRRQDLPQLQFVLKLDSTTPDWQQLFRETQQAATSESHCLVGVSLELPASDLPPCLESLTSLLHYAKTSNTGLEVSSPLQLHLNNPSSSMDPVLLDWLSLHQSSSLLVTLDVSHLLLANAGALCTRIIGVKQTEAGKIHYYIDDGCYGSLSNYNSQDAVQPFPLKKDKEDAADESSEPEEQLLATVWGPTCDGLDKVCGDILLPRLSRDDWLVFGDLGFCHVGTNFNGFEPPDIAYCVLGGHLHPTKHPPQEQR